ncbi:glycosyltransferase family 4 protein [Pseudooceanicola sp. LIPI14-2-Ac024]|uniref:glycosyltransferase family 4 protein n=1 Tax=Pseudooceanicola sp. LIPI14-2-Ac024 TaxID=3344875 RepID=UPI0035CF0DAF
MLLASEPLDHAIACANGLAPHADVVMVSPERLYADVRRWIDPRIDLRLVDWPRVRSPRNAGFLWSLSRLIAAERPDVVHVLSNTTVWLNALPALVGRRPLVVTVHDVEVHPGDRETARLPGWTSRWMARQADHVVVHGETLSRKAHEMLRIERERIHVLPHPTIDRYAALARAEGMRRAGAGNRLTILMFGRLFAYKGLSDLVKAEAILGRGLKDFRLVIAGRGDNPYDLSAEMGDATRYEIHNRFIYDIEVARLFTEADVVVLPYTEASQSGVLHLASAFGTPVVATDVGEIGATVTEHELGIVVPPSDPASLASAIADLARDPERRARFADNSLAWARGPAAPEAVGAMTVDMYRHILRTDEGHLRKVEAMPGQSN